jgi:hypothetical protein
MKVKYLVGGLLLALMPFSGIAQKTKTYVVPEWGPAHKYKGDKYVYFPDYYSFYDPARGYVYWNNGTWTTTTEVPVYMSKVNLNKARVQVIEDMSAAPETRYKTYIKTYPARKVEVVVPIPE